MPRRRSPGEGSVRFRKETGRWQAGVVVGYLPSGNPKRLRKDFNTKREADSWLSHHINLRNRGELATTEATVVAFVTDWLKRKRSELRLNSFTRYSDVLQKDCIPFIGNFRLRELKPHHIARWIAQMQEAGYNSYRVFRAHEFFNMALNSAVDLEYIHRNPAQRVKPPKPPKPNLSRMTSSDVVKFLSWCRNHGETYGGRHQGPAKKRRPGPHKIYNYARLALATGMRREELLGLRWSDIDFEEGYLQIAQSVVFVGGKAVFDKPKTEESEREVMLDSASLEVLKEQLEHVTLTRISAGSNWKEHNLVFTSLTGTPLPESTLRRWWWDAVEGSGVEAIRLYDTRATWISEALASGMNPKAVAKRVGHKDIAYMLKTYARPDREEMRRAAKSLEEMYGNQWQPVAGDQDKGVETGTE